jgi:hypothetical protein
MRVLFAALVAGELLAGAMAGPLHAAQGDSAQPDKPVLLDEISDQNAPAMPCSLATCGTVISIAPFQGNVDIQPGEGQSPTIVIGDDPDPVVTDPLLDPVLAAPGATAYALGEPGSIWQIRVRMTDGAIQTVLQSFQPLFQVGDTVVVENRSIRLWP